MKGSRAIVLLVAAICLLPLAAAASHPATTCTASGTLATGGDPVPASPATQGTFCNIFFNCPAGHPTSCTWQLTITETGTGYVFAEMYSYPNPGRVTSCSGVLSCTHTEQFTLPQSNQPAVFQCGGFGFAVNVQVTCTGTPS